jgi:hypothetical protein
MIALIQRQAKEAHMSEPIKIVRLITEEVGTPRLDGNPGSALYRVPFELSAAPPTGWAVAFVEAWNHPPSYTSRHRPGIASVVGRKVVLDETTVEEVESHHKETLIAAVSQANLHVEQAQKIAAKRRAEAEQRETEHSKQVADAAAKVKFD